MYQARKKLKKDASQKTQNNILAPVKNSQSTETPKIEESNNEQQNTELPKRKRMTIINVGEDTEPPRRMRTLREIEEETDREQRENKRPLY